MITVVSLKTNVWTKYIGIIEFEAMSNKRARLVIRIILLYLNRWAKCEQYKYSVSQIDIADVAISHILTHLRLSIRASDRRVKFDCLQIKDQYRITGSNNCYCKNPLSTVSLQKKHTRLDRSGCKTHIEGSPKDIGNRYREKGYPTSYVIFLENALTTQRTHYNLHII